MPQQRPDYQPQRRTGADVRAQSNVSYRRKRRSWASRNAPTLILFVIFGLLCFALGCLVGRAVAAEDTEDTGTRLAPDTAASSEAPQAQTTEAVVTTTEPVITTTEPEPTDYQDTIDDSTCRTIYLTFDDGPGKYTFDVLDILDRYNIKATFFTVGYYVDHYPDNARAIVERGHLIACHSYTHEFDKCYASVDAFMDEVEQWKEAVRNATGTLPKRLCIRFPGRSTTGYAKNVAEGIKERIAAIDARWFDWNAANNDKYPQGNIHDLPQKEYFIASYKECMGWYVNDDAATVIFLTHETEKTTVETLDFMIQDLLDRGYTFKTLDHHPDWN